MSNSIDPADIKPMAFTTQLDGLPIACQPWERFGLFSDDLLKQEGPWLKMSDDNQEITLTVDNGWARYRRIRMATLNCWVWELCDSAYEARE